MTRSNIASPDAHAEVGTFGMRKWLRGTDPRSGDMGNSFPSPSPSVFIRFHPWLKTKKRRLVAKPPFELFARDYRPLPMMYFTRSATRLE